MVINNSAPSPKRLPPKVYYTSEGEYRAHFEQVYCQGPIITFDGIPVRFRKDDFDHCMFESSKRNNIKDTFAKERSERIDWIKETLINPEAELYQSWDKAKKCHDPNGRIAIVYEDFAVVIRLYKDNTGELKARFVTAFYADNSINKIRGNPKWDKTKCR